MKRRLLIVEDDRRFAAALSRALESDYVIETAASAAETHDLFDPLRFDAVLLDLRLTDDGGDGREGLDLLRILKRDDPTVPVLIMTAYGDIETAVEAVKLGAEEFIQKTRVSPADFKRALDRVFQQRSLRRKAVNLEKRLQRVEPARLMGDDLKIAELKRLIALVAQDGEATVLIRGETGTGKELVAQTIHREGVRRDGPFVAVALPALPQTTIESELFGHERGAFTGASERRIGFIEEARGGILLLDEVGDLPAEVQAKLLRFLETKEVTRVGGTKPISIDVQILAATNQPLEDMVRRRTFREDLYYRLKVFEIFLSPLRERPGDVTILATHFLGLLDQQGRTSARRIAPSMRDRLESYEWPGNVRELRQAIEYAALKAKLNGEETLLPEHLPQDIAGSRPAAPASEGTLPKAAEPGVTGIDVFRRLAETELAYVDAALAATGRKTEVWRDLGYHDRFALRRRVVGLLGKYPQLATAFPTAAAAFSRRTSTRSPSPPRAPQESRGRRRPPASGRKRAR